MTRVLLVTSPFTQLNTAYPATAYLTGFLRRHGYEAAQADLSIETALELFSRDGLTRLFEAIRNQAGSASALRARTALPADHPDRTPAPSSHPAPTDRAPAPPAPPEPVLRALELADVYIDTIDPVIRFLQGRDLTLAHRICHGRFLPEGPRFAALEEDDWAFGTLGVTDRARHLATLYLDDLSDLVRGTVAPHFGLTRYAERLATAATSYDPLAEALAAPPTVVDDCIERAILRHLERFKPDLVGFSVPFPGNLYGALRAAKTVRAFDPSIRTAMGGGYVNTELRELSEPRLFDLIDYVTLDDGERPMLCLLEHLAGQRESAHLKRTFLRQQDKVSWIDGATDHDIPMGATGTPTYDGLPLDRYLSVLEVLNPMHRLWSDGRWNKLTLAHGCYWRKCSFCDINLDYIGRYEPAPATDLGDRIDALVEETGQTGFHFVDEAAPPLLMRDLALELLNRGRVISWWGNIRFEKTFTPDLCRLLAASGCIAVSGGLEVASDRLLSLMKKGVTVAQVARVASAFTQTGIMVHAYLMYGFPTETQQEIVDSLERVRQLFDSGVIQSAFWHRFVATAHSPIGRNPEEYRIQIVGPGPGSFAMNDLEHVDPEGADFDRYGAGLDKAVFNFMYGQALDEDVRRWFDFRVPAPRVPKALIQEALEVSEKSDLELAKTHRPVWLGGPVRRLEASGEAGTRDTTRSVPVRGQKTPGDSGDRATTRGALSSRREQKVELQLTGREADEHVKVAPGLADWLIEVLNECRPRGRGARPYRKLETMLETWPASVEPFERFQQSKAWQAIRAAGLVLV